MKTVPLSKEEYMLGLKDLLTYYDHHLCRLCPSIIYRNKHNKPIPISISQAATATMDCSLCRTIIGLPADEKTALAGHKYTGYTNPRFLPCPCFLLGAKEAERRALLAIKKWEWEREILFRKF